MTTKRKQAISQWKMIGHPAAGTPTALAVAWDGGYTLFVGTEVGLYRSTGFVDGKIEAWKRLPTAPVGILCLGISPNYQEDHTLAAGANTGIYLSRKQGGSWLPA